MGYTIFNQIKQRRFSVVYIEQASTFKAADARVIIQRYLLLAYISSCQIIVAFRWVRSDINASLCVKCIIVGQLELILWTK